MTNTTNTTAAHNALLAAGWALLSATPIRTAKGATMWEMTIGEIAGDREITSNGRDPDKLIADLAQQVA